MIAVIMNSQHENSLFQFKMFWPHKYVLFSFVIIKPSIIKQNPVVLVLAHVAEKLESESEICYLSEENFCSEQSPSQLGTSCVDGIKF